jgi:putative PIN family toxin of toxin-antitoxin system
MRFVLDTNVVVSGLFWKGLPYKLRNRGDGKSVKFFSSIPLLAELADVLSRSKFDWRIAASRLSIAQHVLIYANSTGIVVPRFVSGVAPDPDDDVVIGTAVAANADFIVTGDLALLSVVQYEHVRIVSVGDALNAIAVG